MSISRMRGARGQGHFLTSGVRTVEGHRLGAGSFSAEPAPVRLVASNKKHSTSHCGRGHRTLGISPPFTDRVTMRLARGQSTESLNAGASSKTHVGARLARGASSISHRKQMSSPSPGSSLRTIRSESRPAYPRAHRRPSRLRRVCRRTDSQR